MRIISKFYQLFFVAYVLLVILLFADSSLIAQEVVLYTIACMAGILSIVYLMHALGILMTILIVILLILVIAFIFLNGESIGIFLLARDDTNGHIWLQTYRLISFFLFWIYTVASGYALSYGMTKGLRIIFGALVVVILHFIVLPFTYETSSYWMQMNEGLMYQFPWQNAVVCLVVGMFAMILFLFLWKRPRPKNLWYWRQRMAVLFIVYPLAIIIFHFIDGQWVLATLILLFELAILTVFFTHKNYEQ